jgi:hypothetical protein
MPQVALLVVSFAVTAVTSIIQAKKQKKAAKRAEAAQREGRAITMAQQKINDRRMRRVKAKEMRQRQAAIQQQAEGGGVSGSSGPINAMNALTSNTFSAFGAQREGAKSASGVSNQAQLAAEWTTKANDTSIGDFGRLVSTGIDTYSAIKYPTKTS